MKSSITKTAGAAAVALLALSGAASAEDRQFGWSVNVGGTSDYIFRGVSQTDGDPAFQAGREEIRGDLLVQLGRLDEARAAYEKAKAAQPDDAALGTLQMKLDDLAKGDA